MDFQDLSRRVLIDRLPVTVSYIAKMSKISISKAAEVLEEFYQRYKTEGLIAKYSSCQKGNSADNTRPADLLIKIGNNGDRIFSVQTDNSSLTNVLEMCKKRWDPETLTACGMIQTLTYEPKAVLSETVDIEKPTKQPLKVEPKKSSVRTDVTTTADVTNRPVYTSRKAASAPSATASTKPVYTSRKRGLEKSQQKEDVKRKQEVTKRAKTEPSQTVSKELQELMEDDFTDDDDDVAMEGGQDEYKYDDIDVSAPDVTEHVENDIIEEENNEHPNPIEKITRKDTRPVATQTPKQEEIPEVETHVDSEGYIVTKVNRKPPQSSLQPNKQKYNIDTKPKNTSTVKAGTKQSTLASFFGKKK
ncbi:hypothetical protein CANINC_000220 [Pichia inconspicua]|uniref:DNA polymerase delta subunit 3 n=1 Tax=Pichia inconspicua TaxID=52247 RepID=A0A4T0X722_9ASCO|nr:hypothetical protein CANINC_000220 [[Candida] inconspicua]